MTAPKMAPCPKCNRTNFLDVYKYDSGWRYVECDGGECWYRGPGAGSIRDAIKQHNANCAADENIRCHGEVLR